MIFEFGPYQLDVQRAVLRKNGTRVKVEPQVLTLLELLISRHGEMVSRDDIVEFVWKGRAISQSAIDSRIRSARKAIGDDGKRQRLIKTYTHQGFKFVGAVEEMEVCPVLEAKNKEEIEKTKPRLPIKVLTIALFLGAIGAVSIGYQLNQPHSETNETKTSTVLNDTDRPVNRRSIAVFPAKFDNPELDTTKFSVGVAEETISFLGGVQGINVVSRQASFSLGRKNLPASELIEALQIDYRIENICELHDGILSVSVQLIGSKNENVLWSKRYDIPASTLDMQQAQIDVAKNVSLNVANVMGASASSFSPAIISTDSYEQFSEGQDYLEKGTKEDIEEAIRLFRNVIAAEPEYMPAYARLFDSYWQGWIYAGFSMDVSIPEMQKTVRQMKVLGPNTPETLTAEGMLMPVDGSDYTLDEVLDLFDRAISTNPNYALAYKERANAFYSEGLPKEEIEAYEDALKIDPVDPEIMAGLSWAYFESKDTASANTIANRNVKWNPDSVIAKTALARIKLYSTDLEHSIVLLREVLDEQPGSYAAKYNLFQAYRRLGNYKAALDIAPMDSQRAYAAALIKDVQLVEKYTATLPEYYGTQQVQYLMGNSEPLYKRLKSRKDTLRIYQDAYKIPMTDILRIISEVDVLRKHNDELADVGLQKIISFYEGYSNDDYDSGPEYIGRIGLYILQDDLDSAMTILKRANDAGFFFLDALELPVFSGLKEHSEFSREWQRMEARAEGLRSRYGTMSNQSAE